MRALLAIVVVVAAGCGSPLVVSDRHDVARDRESVNTYATGAVVTFFVRSTSILVDAEQLAGSSSDESVLTVLDGVGGVMQIQTVAAGSAELVFRVDGNVVDSRRINVVDPASVTLTQEAFRRADNDLLPPPTTMTEPLLALRGREARFIVHVADAAGTELFGNALTSASVSDLTGADAWTTAIEAEGPYSALVISPTAAATSGTLRLQVGGPLLTVGIAVEGRDVSAIERVLMTEGGADNARSVGQRSLVYARAEDATGATLFGSPGWQLEGQDVGISFAVEYKVGFAVQGQELVARLGGVEARRTVYAEAGSVAAVSSCAQGGETAAIALVACGVLGVFRRRSPRPR